MKISYIKKRKYLILVLIIFMMGCEKFVDIDAPRNELNPDLAFTNEETATAAVVGIYGHLWDEGFWTAYYTGLTSDELAYVSTESIYQQFYENAILPENQAVSGSWNNFYQCILSANTVLEKLQSAYKLSDDLRQKLEGEAIFLRALCNFYLVNLYGSIPIITSTRYEINRVSYRQSVNDVYLQIIDDLIKARSLLSENYIDGSRVRPTKSVASALLARVYLYRGEWILSESEANKVINNNSYNLIPVTDPLAIKNNPEIILQIYPMQANINAYEGFYFIVRPGRTMSTSGTFLSESLLNSFETDDMRFLNWVGTATILGDTSYYPNKYKVRSGTPATEYPIFLRLSEQYLIRAEARIMQGNIIGAQQDLNVIRNRAGLPNTTANDQSSLLLAIEHERRVELFTEVGHRWFDLKRTGRIDAVLGSKPNWEPSDALFPIPAHEILNNPNMTQNPNY